MKKVIKRLPSQTKTCLKSSPIDWADSAKNLMSVKLTCQNNSPCIKSYEMDSLQKADSIYISCKKINLFVIFDDWSDSNIRDEATDKQIKKALFLVSNFSRDLFTISYPTEGFGFFSCFCCFNILGVWFHGPGKVGPC